MSEEGKKRRGPKPKPTGEIKRKHLAFRLQDKLHAKLTAAAESVGRSISEEIERRVEDSFRIEDEFGSGGRLTLIRLLASTLRMTEMLTRDDRYDSRSTLQEAKAAIDVTLERFIEVMGSGDPARDKLVDIVANAGQLGHAAATVQWMGYIGETSTEPGPLPLPPGGEKALKIFISQLRSPQTLAELVAGFRSGHSVLEPQTALMRFKEGLEARVQAGDRQAIEDAARLKSMEQTGKPLVEAWEDQKDRSVTEAFDAQHEPKAAVKPGGEA